MNLDKLVKATLDRVASTIALIVFSPLMLVIMASIYISMGGPVIFAQPRPGQGSKIFMCYKFRTMLPDTRATVMDDPIFTGTHPPDAHRITPLGRFLRETSLDELPQLWNILKGDMSFVGPRPLVVSYLSRYSPEQARRHEVIPGITGLAQIEGRNLISWEDRFTLDVWYVDHWTLWLDFKILFITLFKVIKREGISIQGDLTKEEFRGVIDQ